MESFLRLLFDHWIITIIFAFVVASVIGSIAKQLRKYGCHRSEVGLKRELVERGLSVDEIERIIAAQSVSIKEKSEA
jgi:hypothetical protein